MDTRIYWFTAVAGYIIQTKCISYLQTRDKHDNISDDNVHRGLMIVLAFMYFGSLVVLSPVARFFDKAKETKRKRNPAAPLTLLSSSSDLELQTLAEEEPVAHVAVKTKRDDKIDSSHGISLAYCAKLLTLSILLLIPILSYIMALSMSPGFDVALIQNTSIFEITTLLYGVCGFTNRKKVVSKFMVMMIALLGILIVSYTKATCDLLAGKLSINEKTGELNDPYLFDRLKSSLLCGLGALTMGPFAVFWNRWFNKRSQTVSLSQQCSHLSLIGMFCMVMLLPFFPSMINTLSSVYKDQQFWLFSLISVFMGTWLHAVSLLQVNRKSSPEYSTTINLGTIIFMGISDWICESGQTTIVRWEVIGYIMLSVCCIMLSFSYYDKKRITIHP